MKRLDLSRFQEKFIKLVYAYLDQNGINQEGLANQVEMHRATLNALLNGKRKLSAYYLSKFIKAGVFKVSDINDNFVAMRREQRFWDEITTSIDNHTIERLNRLKQLGFDIEAMLNKAEKKARVDYYAALINCINRLRNNGIDVDKVLDAIDPE